MARIYQRYCFLLVFNLILFACHSPFRERPSAPPSSSEAPPIYLKLNAADFARQLAELDNELLIDVRTSEEYQSGHLPDAQLLSFRDANFRSQAQRLERNRPVMVYCAAGGRSSAAAVVLQELGFDEIYELRGGLTSWIGEGRAVAE